MMYLKVIRVDLEQQQVVAYDSLWEYTIVYRFIFLDGQTHFPQARYFNSLDEAEYLNRMIDAAILNL